MNIGIAHVSPGYNQGPTVLQDGAALVASLRARTLKIWTAPSYATNYPGETWGGVPTSLKTLVQLAPYVSVLGSASFDRYFLGAWTFANGVNDPWKGSLSQSQADAEYTEVYDLCVHLLSTYANKDFVIQTAESDWVIINSNGQTPFDPSNKIDPRLVDRAVHFYGARVRAIADARKAVPGSSSRVFSCVECNRVLDGGTRVHRDILPRVQPDVVSWTSYEAINDWIGGALSQAQVEANIASKIAEVARRVREAMVKAQGPRGANVPFIVGEVGWPEAHPLFGSTYDAGGFMRAAVNAALLAGCAGLNHWQLWDNEVYTSPPPTHPRRQAIYDENGSLTRQGSALLTYL